MLAQRIKKATTLNLNQRGFVDGDGALANCLLLDTYIHSKREQIRPHTVLSLDITKAFDNISHHSLKRALLRHGIDGPVLQYIMSDLASSMTTIRLGENHSRPISINRGVKQGDPLSPILFNIVVDELLDLIQNNGYKGTIYDDDFDCPIIAFARTRHNSSSMWSINS